MKKRIVIFISGRGSNMETLLRQAREGILRDCCEVLLVFSNRPDAKGLQIAEACGVPTASIPSKGKKREDFDRQVLELLQPLRADYIVLAGYMRMLSPLFIRSYPRRIINIHPADTGEFQGVGGYEWAYRRGLKKTFITVHYVDEGMDTGEVIARRELDLRGLNSLEQIEEKGLALEHRMYSEVLKKVFEGSNGKA
jgi:phosphoribosylglycinamide formyltransferase 1